MTKLGRVVVVVGKQPRLGFGKSRLAVGLGPVRALRAARALLAQTLWAATDRRWRTELWLTPDPKDGRSLVQDIAVRGQGGGDLGTRLGRVMAAHPRTAVLVIGTDAPSLRPADLAKAFAQLRRAPFVLGSAHDGGFWLFGARAGRLARGAFEGVRWSHPETAADLIARLPGPVACLRTLGDVDTAADWQRLHHELGRRRSNAT